MLTRHADHSKIVVIDTFESYHMGLAEICYKIAFYEAYPTM